MNISNKVAYVLLAILVASTAQAGHYGKHTASMQPEPGTDNLPSDGDTSTMFRFRNSGVIEVRTSGLDPDSPYTLWAVIFNNPRYCASSPCTRDDLPFNAGADQRIDVSIIYAGGGQSDSNGMGRFTGRVFESIGGLVTADRLYGFGLRDVQKAEIHVVVRGHGKPAPEDFFAAYSSFDGGCNSNNTMVPACEDQQFAVRPPAKRLNRKSTSSQ